jgi:hypothetical protein
VVKAVHIFLPLAQCLFYNGEKRRVIAHGGKGNEIIDNGQWIMDNG